MTSAPRVGFRRAALALFLAGWAASVPAAEMVPNGNADEDGNAPILVVTRDVAGEPGVAIPLAVEVRRRAGRSSPNTYLLGLPKGARLADTSRAVIAAEDRTVVEVTDWNLSELSVTLEPQQTGTFTLAVAALSRPENGEPLRLSRSTFTLDAQPRPEIEPGPAAAARPEPEPPAAIVAARLKAAAQVYVPQAPAIAPLSPSPAEARIEAKPEAKPEARVAAKAETKTAAKAETKAEAWTEAAPAASTRAGPKSAEPPTAPLGAAAPARQPEAAPRAAPVAQAQAGAKPAAAQSASPAPSAAPALAPAPSSAPAAASAPVPAEPKPQALVERAERLIRLGDISGARLVLERAMDRGEPRAVFLLAQTCDPRMLRAWKVQGLQPDPERARALYARAAREGLADPKSLAEAMR
ncbi:hypothetical protein [Methylobacterium oxalidis]|uniref:Uncharacterized protein n=1 Tax=Methylobacterium oxalidis TaxID=944322 RepID=A0A512J5V0_9HYPH|nr:hypothetical protein [Methylobacterium oxalidis]GEP05357.1 hypothetical protein MOX02_33950 [Methylobacterium oxalidis]GJE31367.1 hypothetical protein LDDCCGHA_1544 [Methylobacterium oxalidis]GLS63505.1 hypothetical protein GCM10007888_18860 [Methylobacterium oxalidis]